MARWDVDVADGNLTCSVTMLIPLQGRVRYSLPAVCCVVSWHIGGSPWVYMKAPLCVKAFRPHFEFPTVRMRGQLLLDDCFGCCFGSLWMRHFGNASKQLETNFLARPVCPAQASTVLCGTALKAENL